MRVRRLNTVEFPDLTIHKARKKNIQNRLKMRKKKIVDPYQSRLYFIKCASSIQQKVSKAHIPPAVANSGYTTLI